MVTADELEEKLRSKYNELALQELQFLRDTLIGSTGLLLHMREVVLEDGGPGDLKEKVLCKEEVDYEAFPCLGGYIFEVAVGCVALAHKGLWPDKTSTSESDAGADATAKPNWNLFKEALAATETPMEMLLKTKPDWTKFNAVISSQRETGKLKGVEKWSAAKTQAALNDIHETFIEVLEDVYDFEDSYFHLRNVPPEVVLKAFDSVPWLSKCKDDDPFEEAVRVRGQWVIEEVARTVRNEGNELFKRGSALTGEAQDQAWSEAENKYQYAMCGTEEDEVTNTNLAALHLAQKQYANAIGAAQEAILREDLSTAPVRFDQKRNFVLARLSGDESYEDPADDEAYERNPLLKPYDRDSIIFKAHIRSARAHTILFEAGIKGEEVDTDPEVDPDEPEGPWAHFFSAYEDYSDALEFTDEDVSVVRKELKKLEVLYKWALEADDGTHDKEEYEDRFDEIVF